MSKGIVISPEKCTGCRICELTCSFTKYGSFNPKDAAISISFIDEVGLQVPNTCLQCDEPECVTACPVNALEKDDSTGVINYDSEKCIECEICVSACPFDSITYSPRLNKVIKCDECSGDPQCVKLCPSGALEYKELDNSIDRRKNIDDLIEKAFEEVAK